MSFCSKYSHFLSLLAFLFIVGCSDKDDKIPKKNRVVLFDQSTKNLLKSEAHIEIPSPVLNTDWTQISGLPFNDIGNLQGIDNFSKVKTVYIGDTQDDNNEATMQPVFSAGTGFFFSVESELIALDLQNHEILWKKTVTPTGDADVTPRGGGLVSDGGYVFIATNSGIIAGFDAKTGKQIWRLNNKVPFSAAPTLYSGVLYVIDRDNRLQAIDARTGQALWDYRGLPEASSYSRVAGAAVYGSVLIAPFTSGELTAINTQTHKAVWGQTIIGNGLNSGDMQFTTISGEVVISNKIIYVSVPSGLTTALDGLSGKTLWQQEIGSAKTLLSVGGYIYALDTNAVLYALDKQNGGVIWKRHLERYTDADTKTGNIEWTSPLMSNGKIVLFSNIGKALLIDAVTGKIIHSDDDAPETIIDPAIANGKIYVHAKDGDVYIYQ